jgi:predicted cation transporter
MIIIVIIIIIIIIISSSSSSIISIIISIIVMTPIRAVAETKQARVLSVLHSPCVEALHAVGHGCCCLSPALGEATATAAAHHVL